MRLASMRPARTSALALTKSLGIIGQYHDPNARRVTQQARNVAGDIADTEIDIKFPGPGP